MRVLSVKVIRLLTWRTQTNAYVFCNHQPWLGAGIISLWSNKENILWDYLFLGVTNLLVCGTWTLVISVIHNTSRTDGNTWFLERFITVNVLWRTCAIIKWLTYGQIKELISRDDVILELTLKQDCLFLLLALMFTSWLINAECILYTTLYLPEWMFDVSYRLCE